MAIMARPSKRHSPGKRRSEVSQSIVVADGMAADFDAAMVAIGGLVAVEACRIGVGEEALDFGGKGGPVVLEAREIVGALGANGLGDVGLAAHGVDGDQRAGQFQALEQRRNGSDFVGFFRAGLLPQHEPLAARPGRDQMQRILALASVVGAPRSLAVDGDDVGHRASRRPATQETKQSRKHRGRQARS